MLVKFVVDDILAPRRPKHSGTSAFIGSRRTLENLTLTFRNANRIRIHCLSVTSYNDSLSFFHLFSPFGRFVNIFILPFSHLGFFATMYSLRFHFEYGAYYSTKWERMSTTKWEKI